MKNRPTCQIPCAYHALFRPFVRYAVYIMKKSTFSRFSSSDPPGCLLGVSGCLWVPLGASGCLLDASGCLLGASWMPPESPGSLLGFSSSQMRLRCLSDASHFQMHCSRCLSDTSQMPLRYLSDASQIPLRYLSDASQMPLRCLSDVSHIPSPH